MFRPDTFEQVVVRSVVGVRAQAAKRFGVLKAGDRFVAYVSRKQVLGGHGEVLSASYFDETPIYPGAHGYPYRVDVRVETAIHEVAAGNALWAVKSLRSSKMVPWGVLLNRGSFTELEPGEYEWLMQQMTGSAA